MQPSPAKPDTFIPWAAPALWGNEQRYITEALSSTWISGGPFVERLEKLFVDYWLEQQRLLRSQPRPLPAVDFADYGLSASVWTSDVGRAMRMTAALDFGCVWVNDHIPIVSEMPHGGFKQSGYGKDMSIYAIEAYTELKHVMIKH